MAAPYSADLRERMVRAVEAGASRRSTARQFAVSVSCVVKLMQRWRAAGTVAPKPMGGKAYALAAHAALVRELVAARPDITLDELRAHLAGQGIEVGRTSISRFLGSLGLTRKKRRSMRPSRTGPMSPRRARPGAWASHA
jgi:transposase